MIFGGDGRVYLLDWDGGGFGPTHSARSARC